MSDNFLIANTIIQQLGGNRFRIMTGSNSFAALSNGVIFRVPCRTVNLVRIILEADDTYTVKYVLQRGVKATLKAEEKGLHWDQLQESFTRNTGLYTSL